MKLMVVSFALIAAACASIVPLAQPAHHAALLLDPHGRPLDTAEVINARAIHLQAKALEPHGNSYGVVAPIVHGAAVRAAAVSHQSRVDVHSSPAIVAAAPVFSDHGGYSAPILAHSVLGLSGHGHLLKKRSLGHYDYAASVYAAVPAAISHQSRVDVSSPAVLSHAIAAPAAVVPVVAHAVVPAAVSHQSRVDVRTSPSILSHSVVTTPVLSAPVFNGHHSLALSGHGHVLKKRSLGHVIAHAPAAVSHQSRVDVYSKPAIVEQTVSVPVAVEYTAPAVLAHAAPAVPLSHSAIWSVPASHLHHAATLVHAAHL